ncbi:hypothetical protein L2E82_02538 [Cichorium intybus]|uniref:Uncharacterized protein n=1 Tax=Cichorium intybus TaxID=13427 RepID=A0ACB9H1Y7_CICIN|nr:hypothetical protein L2E82_02538 [Cichorium intybus]
MEPGIAFSREPSTNSEKFNINPSLSPPSFYQSKARLYQSIWRIPEDFLSHAAAVLNLRPPEVRSPSTINQIGYHFRSISYNFLPRFNLSMFSV